MTEEARKTGQTIGTGQSLFSLEPSVVLKSVNSNV